MEHQSRYQAKKPDANGIIPYTAEEHQTWSRLMTRQTPVVHARACQEFLHGLNTLQMAPDHIPQNHEINTLLNKKTGWSVVTVEALISDDYFFQLLAEKKFPAASFIRRPEEINYLPEPDIFHELYGHCPMLTNPTYAAFMQKYGEIAAKANPEDRKLLGRLYVVMAEAFYPQNKKPFTPLKIQNPTADHLTAVLTPYAPPIALIVCRLFIM
jgi:phenylalanine-4-hydroxylase